MDPSSLELLLRLKPVRLGNEPKSNWASVPSSSVSERFITVTLPVVSQAIPVQLQRFPVLVRDHDELRREEEIKLFFHLIRASASVVDDDVTFKGSKTRKRIGIRKRGALWVIAMLLMPDSYQWNQRERERVLPRVAYIKGIRQVKAHHLD